MAYNRFLFYDSGFQQLSLSAINPEAVSARNKSPFLLGDTPKPEENFLNNRAQEMIGSSTKVMTGLNLQQSRPTANPRL